MVMMKLFNVVFVLQVSETFATLVGVIGLFISVGSSPNFSKIYEKVSKISELGMKQLSDFLKVFFSYFTMP